MKNARQACLWAGGVLVCALIAAGIWQWRVEASRSPELYQVIGESPAGLPMHLYSGAIDAKSGKPLEAREQSYDVLGPDRKKLASYVVNKDGTTEDLFYQPGSDDKLTVKRIYYAAQPGVNGRRPHEVIFYLADGERTDSDEVYRENGTAQYVSRFLDNGYKDEKTLFADGHTVETEKVWRPNRYLPTMTPDLLSESRWLNDPAHTQVYTDVLNADDSRDQAKYDEHRELLMEAHITVSVGAGTHVKVYYPGTKKLRLEGSYREKDGYASIVGNVYDLNGTLLCTEVLVAGSVEATYYDASGTKPRFTQTFYTETTYHDGKWEEHWILSNVAELADDGSTIREVSYTDNLVPTVERRYNVTVGGVKYDKVQYWYTKGVLAKVEVLMPGSTPNILLEIHTPAENIQVVIAPDELRPVQVYPELPVPPPQGDH